MTNIGLFSSSPFYIAGGTLGGDAPSYVRRNADDDLYEGLLRGEFCYILTARQMGKSSLMVRAGARLEDDGIAVAVLDLTAIGQNVTPEQWYAGLAMQLGYRLGLADQVMSFWQMETALGPLQRWIGMIRDVILPRRSPQRIVIFIDEIDAVRSLPFSADEFFAGIRECYNQRSRTPEMERLSFGLLGVAAPTDLIRDTRMTPFNIGRRIELQDFTLQEATPLAHGLGNGQGHAILKRILHWTGGHPYLTQRLCLEMTQDAQINQLRNVDDLCTTLFFSHRAQERDDNLLFVRERMLRAEVDPGSLLDLYRRIRKGKTVCDDEMNPITSNLQLSGIVRTMNGKLKVRNRIYSRVFDQTWINTVMPQAELRRQKAAFRRGIWRTALVAALIVALAVTFTLIAYQQGQARADSRLLYDAKMRLAQEAWDHSYVDRVEELLNDTAPQPGQEDLRGFEWYLFQQFANRDVRGWTEPYRVVSSSLSEDGKILYVADLQQKANEPDTLLLKSYDLASQRELRALSVPTDAAFARVLFSPDKKRVTISGPKATIEQWDLPTGAKIAVFTGHHDHLSALALSFDGTLLASGDLNGIVKLWDLHQNKEILTLPKQPNWPRSVSISPGGKLLAIADNSLRVSLWDLQTGLEAGQFVSKRSVTAVAFFPDGKRLLMANRNGVLQIWNIRDNQVAAPLPGHSGVIESFAFSNNGQLFATGSWDRTARLWSASTGHELQTIRGHGDVVNSVSFSSNGDYLITGAFDHRVKIWDIVNTPVSPRPPDGVQHYFATAFSAVNDLLAVGIDRDDHVKLWDLSSGREIATIDEAAHDLMCAAFSADSRLLATGGLSKEIRIWEVATGRLIQKLKGHSDAIFSVAFSPNSKLLISGGNDRTLRLWDVAGGDEKAQLKGNLDNSYRAVFSPSGEQIASGTREGTVQLWDVASRRVTGGFRGHIGQVRAIAFSADGKWLATGADDHTLRLWGVASGKLLRTLGLADVIQRATFSPDGRRLITGGVDGAIRLWDIFSGQELMTLPGHTDEVTSITFSGDGKALVTGGADGVIRLWTTARNASSIFSHQRSDNNVR